MRHTEDSVVALLRERYSRQSGNGPEYAFMRGVRNAAGYDASRAFDAVAVALWPSRHLELTIFEVKVSRSDWLRELKANPNGGTDRYDKAGPACALADRFVIVAPVDVVRGGELPEHWGLLEVHERTYGTAMLREAKSATLLKPRSRFPEPIPRGFVVAMLRRTSAVGGTFEPPDELEPFDVPRSFA